MFLLFLFITLSATFPQLFSYSALKYGQVFNFFDYFPSLCFSSISMMSLKLSGNTFQCFPLPFLVLWGRIFQFHWHSICVSSELMQSFFYSSSKCFSCIPSYPLSSLITTLKCVKHKISGEDMGIASFFVVLMIVQYRKNWFHLDMTSVPCLLQSSIMSNMCTLWYFTTNILAKMYKMLLFENLI